MEEEEEEEQDEQIFWRLKSKKERNGNPLIPPHKSLYITKQTTKQWEIFPAPYENSLPIYIMKQTPSTFNALVW